VDCESIAAYLAVHCRTPAGRVKHRAIYHGVNDHGWRLWIRLTDKAKVQIRTYGC
jgi:hypothetical protein